MATNSWLQISAATYIYLRAHPWIVGVVRGFRNFLTIGKDQAISKSLMFPMEFAATKVEDWPRQHTDEMNCAVSSTSSPESGSVLLNLNDTAGIGRALW